MLVVEYVVHVLRRAGVGVAPSQRLHAGAVEVAQPADPRAPGLVEGAGNVGTPVSQTDDRKEGKGSQKDV